MDAQECHYSNNAGCAFSAGTAGKAKTSLNSKPNTWSCANAGLVMPGAAKIPLTSRGTRFLTLELHTVTNHVRRPEGEEAGLEGGEREPFASAQDAA
jgi:hypothetical protein